MSIINKIQRKIYTVTSFIYKKIIVDKNGMGTIEVIIIIAVLVTLALIFRTFIMDLASDIFDKIKDKTDSTINGL